MLTIFSSRSASFGSRGVRVNAREHRRQSSFLIES
jgi:hypothetical protein